MSAPVDPRFGARMRDLLAESGISYRALAARTHHGKSYLHDLAAGRKAPPPEVAARIDDALAAGGQLVALAAGGPGPAEWSIDGWGRRDAEQLAALVAGDTPGPHNAVALAHQWLITDPPQVYELRAGRRIGGTTLTRVEERVRQLRLLDDHVGGSQTYAMVTGELDATVGLLRAGAYTDAVGRRLLMAVADLCQLAGFVAADAGRYDDARRLYIAGVRAGHAAGDRANAANNLSSLAYLESNVGDRRQAVTLARSAYAGGRHAADPTGLALLLERVAWTHARAAEGPSAERALNAVEDTYGRRDGEPVSWAYWLTEDEVEIMAGRVWTQLQRPLRAVPILERATGRYDGHEVPRETSLYLTWLAEALLQAGEVERATDTAGEALRLARGAHSHRALRRVDVVRRRLVAAAGSHRAVQGFVEMSADVGGHPADTG